jgi:hypothetical protein
MSLILYPVQHLYSFIEGNFQRALLRNLSFFYVSAYFTLNSIQDIKLLRTMQTIKIILNNLLKKISCGKLFADKKIRELYHNCTLATCKHPSQDIQKTLI